MMLDVTSWTELLKAFGAVLAVGAAALAGLFKLKPHLKNTKYYKSGVSAANVINYINQLKLGVPHASEVTIIRVRNGDGSHDGNQKPKFGAAIYATNWATKEEWKNEFEIEDNLVAVIGAALYDGHCVFFPEQLQDQDTLNWYEANQIYQSVMLRIAVNPAKSTGLFMIVNFDKKHIVAPKTRIFINTYLNNIQDEFRPEGYFAKKNYVTS